MKPDEKQDCLSISFDIPVITIMRQRLDER